MAREYVPIFFDWLEVTQDLTAEEKGNLIDAVIAYASGEEYEHFLSGGCKIAFRFMKGQVDRNNAISDSRSKAGSSKKDQTETNEIKTEQTETKSIKSNQTESNLPKENNKEKEKENKKESVKRFSPPTMDELTSFIQENNLKVDAERFMNYYTSNGWMVGRNHMKDWKATVKNWARDGTQTKQTKTVSAQAYDQRDYSELGDETPEEMIARLQEAML